MPTFEPRFKDLVSLFNDSLTRNANRPLFGTKKNGQWSWINYAEFGRVVDLTRAGLAQLGVGKGDRVAIIANNRVEWAAAAYATYGLGGAFVPMYEAQQSKEWKFILNDSETKVCFCSSPEIAAKVKAFQGELTNLQHVITIDAPAAEVDSFEWLQALGEKSPRPSVVPDPKLIAAFIYTSGTTGNPKGVLLSHTNVASNVSAALSLLPVLAEDRTLSFLPWAHSFGQTCELHLMIAAGVSMGLCEGVDKIISNLSEVKPTILLAVPRIFNKVYDGTLKKISGRPKPIQAIFHAAMSAQSKLKKGESPSLGERIALPLAKKIIFPKILETLGGRLRFAVSGGARLDPVVGEFIDNLGVTIFEGYGLSETSPIAACNTPDARRIGTVGKAIPGVTITLDQSASDTPGEGEIVIHGHCVMQGYHNLAEESAKVFTPDGGFRSGDLGTISADGFISVTGRVKELYKLENGKYVAPAALEEKVQLSPYILQAMVFGANKPHNVAVLVPKLENLKEWATAHKLDASNVKALLTNTQVKALIRAEIDKHAAEFKGFESIKDFLLTDEEFTVNNDMLTPKLSMKRRNIVTRFEKELNALYTSGKGESRKAAVG
jgi:long-chain acyl-CoA synthetase